jgi:hypothetical protein
MPTVRVRSALAMRIANLDRVKFNDAVANGNYPCAPATVRGSVRLFNEDDLVALYFFARLLELNIPPSRAGQLACEAMSAARGRGLEESDRIVLLRSEHDHVFVGSKIKLPDGTIKTYDPDHEKNGTHYPGLGRVVLAIEFYVSHVRKIIADRIEDERSILGREEEDD